MELGLDIVEIERVRKLGKSAPRFLSRVFTPAEIAYCRGKKNPWQHFAVRFAAKEAVWKALDRDGISLKDISVSRDSRGKPGVLLKGRRASGLKLSLSHSDHYAVAVAVKA
ncbi:MAG: holo-ACP synthase [Elusimicrobia bacterium]|nr:holo-ACP synthase [Elusimicrobiota bacterium]